MPDPLPSLWDYALALYSRPGVSENCLRLQDDHNWNVNLILACIWYGHYLGELSGAQCQAIHADAADWDAKVVTPLRQMRRWLKSHAQSAGKKQGTGTETEKIDIEALRESVKRLELAGEKKLLQEIERNLLTNDRPHTGVTKQTAARQIRSNLALMGQSMNTGMNDAEQHLLDTVLHAWEASFDDARN